MTINSRQKGARGERELRDVLRAAGWGATIRGQQRSGVEQADVVGGPGGFHWESKVGKRPDLWKASQQAARDAKPGEVPVVAAKRDRGSWVACLPLSDLLVLIRRVEVADLLG